MLERLYQALCPYSAAEWLRAIDTLAPSIHEIDRNATRIWFAFYPLDVHLALEQAAAEGPEALTERTRKLGLMGRWRLADGIDSSHAFLYAHRYWPQVKSAVAAAAAAEARPGALPAVITAVADAASRTARVDREMLVGLSAVALMTLRQAGPEAFAAVPGKVQLSAEARRMTPHQVLSRRARDNWQGVFGFLRGWRKHWRVTFNESDPSATFTAIDSQEMASAAQTDKRDFRSADPRCIPGEGPIPVECRAASCGTCWVGVLGGAGKLSPVAPHDEGRRLKVFGYSNTDEPNPLIRLACQARVHGAVSVVIPPWNGMYGNHLTRQKAEGKRQK